MKCPHCGYVHGMCWTDDNIVPVKGKHGDFYRLPTDMVRTDAYAGVQTISLYACPECMKTFIQK